jgi:hypothetical protein
MKFKFFLIKFLNKSKTVEIKAIDLLSARHKIEKDFPDWMVSMFWPIVK